MKKNGYTILILILVLMAISLSIITTVNFLGIDQAKLSVAKGKSSLALYLSTACAEEALELIKSSVNPDTYQQLTETRLRIVFPGNVEHSCWYSIKDSLVGPSSSKYIYARSEFNDFPRKIEIKLSANRPMIIEYWQEK